MISNDPPLPPTPKSALRLAIAWGFLFSLQSLGTCVLVGLGNAQWVGMAAQNKILLCIGIFVNWSGTMMAFISKAVSRIEQGKPPPTNGTDFLKKSDLPGGPGTATPSI